MPILQVLSVLCTSSLPCFGPTDISVRCTSGFDHIVFLQVLTVLCTSSLPCFGPTDISVRCTSGLNHIAYSTSIDGALHL
ncbi:MAG: hypothetical protein NTV75_09585 [Bacteroidia bacterium]|nr:hypothetical protein [Bacteroidia bacterium]